MITAVVKIRVFDALCRASNLAIAFCDVNKPELGYL